MFKVIFITQDDPFYIPVYLDNIFAKLNNDSRVIKVYALPPNLPESNFFQTVKYYSSFYGLIILLYLVFLRLYYLFDDYLRKHLGINKGFHSAELICRKYKISFSRIKDINAQEILNELRGLGPDIIFSLASPQIFSNALLKIPAKCSLNIHSSLLPKFRGINANFWALAKGEEVTGVSIHYMNHAIDGGDIILQEEIKIQDKWSLNDLYLAAIEAGSGMVAKCIKMISEGNVVVQKNDISSGSYFTFPAKKDVREFRMRNRKFFKMF